MIPVNGSTADVTYDKYERKLFKCKINKLCLDSTVYVFHIIVLTKDLKFMFNVFRVTSIWSCCIVI